LQIAGKSSVIALIQDSSFVFPTIYTPKIALYEKKYKKNTISQKKYLQSHRPWFILNIAVA